MQHGDWRPEELLELSGIYWKACALHAGVKLGVFTVIGDEATSGEVVAKRCGADPRGTTLLLNALSAMQLLSKKGNTYSTVPAARLFLSKDSGQYIGHMIMHHHHLSSSWVRLHEAVVTGRPLRKRASTEDDHARESFLMAMSAIGMLAAPQIAKILDLPLRRRLLDLGGGPGTYAIHFCMAHENLEAVVFDLPTTEAFARKTIEGFGMGERVRFQAGDYLEDDLGAGYDVVWLSQILHGEGPEACQLIIEKAVSALEPGGAIFVHECLLDETMACPLQPALFSLNMLLGTPRGRSYSEGHIERMMRRAGVTKIRRLPFCGPNESGIIEGHV
ncbi:methyltransferase [Thermodesulfobacteriota bacterium]